MESNTQGAGQQPAEDKGSLTTQHIEQPENDTEADDVVYADLGIDGQPDVMNPGDEEATDTLLYTDNSTARNATDGLSNDEDLDGMPADLLAGDLSDDELDREISDLAEDEDAAGEPY